MDYCRYASEDSEIWNDFYSNYGNLLASLEFPCGEIFNPVIQGYLFAWKLQNNIRTTGIEIKDNFVAQGLEGKAVTRTNLITALLVWKSLPQFRCQVKIEADINKVLKDFTL